MDIERIVAELEAERKRLAAAITALKRVSPDGTRVHTRRKGSRRLSAAARKRLSELMKKRWASGKLKRH